MCEDTDLLLPFLFFKSVVMFFLCFRYKGGDRLNVAFLPDATDNTLLVLNARDNFTASITKSWLDGLVYLELLQVMSSSCQQLSILNFALYLPLYTYWEIKRFFDSSEVFSSICNIENILSHAINLF